SVKGADGQRRLDDPADFVRREVERALTAGIPVVPVLVSQATMPGESDLPGSLRPLAMRHGVSVRPDPDFHRDMDRLVDQIAALLSAAGQTHKPDSSDAWSTSLKYFYYISAPKVDMLKAQ